MGVPVPPEEIPIAPIKFYVVHYLHYFKLGGPPCDNLVAVQSCCRTGAELKIEIAGQCFQGAIWCFSNPDASFRVTGWSGPYADRADCIAGTPGENWVPQGFRMNLNHVIMNEYSFYPESGGKSEINIPAFGNAWGFFSDGKRNLHCHVRFDAIEVSQVL